MLKHLLCTAVLICGAMALRADVFSFSYAGAGVSASLTLTANSIGSGAYTVTGITGTRNGKAITNWPGDFLLQLGFSVSRRGRSLFFRYQWILGRGYRVVRRWQL